MTIAATRGRRVTPQYSETFTSAREQPQQEQVANGFAKATHNALLHAVNNLFSPRIGLAWDPTGKGDWAVRGGFGMYNNWLTHANVQEEFRGSPPGLVFPTFFAGGTATRRCSDFRSGKQRQTAIRIHFPHFPGGLNAQGGVVGASFKIGGINPTVEIPEGEYLVVLVGKKTVGPISRPALDTPDRTPTILSATAITLAGL